MTVADRLRRARPHGLGARLVLTVVAMVVVVSVLLAGVTTLAVRAYLVDRLDEEVTASLARAQRGPVIGDDGPRGGGPMGDPRDGIDDRRGQGVGTLTVVQTPSGMLLGDVIEQGRDGETSRESLSPEALERVAALPEDGEPRDVRLPGVGTYRVVRSDLGGVTVAAGLPTEPVTDVVATLVAWQAALVVLGAAVAAGGGLVLVRRQLRPLREVAATAHDVAALPLAEGEIEVAPRVRDVDERTEVGRVGAALNTLLAHVEASLAARYRSEQNVRRFVADASHELRTPLATITGYAELAGRRPEDRAAQEAFVAKVREESRRMSDLVEDLLLLARLDADRPLAREPVDLTRLLVEATSDARLLAPDHAWRLELPDEAVEVVGDEHRLHQVVTNLLTNARKHTPAGTTVTVTARPGGFSVHDDGPGFPPGLADRAFDRFTRGDEARHRRGGAGLGLALVQAIVGAHGGRVTLHSEPGDTCVDVALG